jgi:DNA-binding transcriptional regulator LsrR (DeoR family)
MTSQVTPPEKPGQDELLTQVASMYFLEDLTQAEIAKRLGLSRPKVGRLLSQAKETGIVEITVNLPTSLSAPIETEMSERFGLIRTVVVADDEDESRLREAAGKEAARILDGMLVDGSIVAVGMGRNARAVARASLGKRVREATFISAMGGAASIGSGLNSNDVAERLAQAFGGTARGIFAPAYADNESLRDTFLMNKDVRNTLELAKSAHIALVSIGDANKESLVVKLGLITEKDMLRMRQEGAVGDILGSFVNVQGDTIAPWIEERVVGLVGARDLRSIPNVIAVAPETSKAEAVLGVLRSGVVTTLITSMSTARSVLKLANSGDK